MTDRDSQRDDAFTAFVAEKSTRLLRYCFLLTGNPADADDLLQTALLKAYQHWDRIDAATAEGYVRRIITHSHVSMWRKFRRKESPSDQIPDGSVHQPDVAAQDEVLQALQKLGERQRAVVVLRFYEDLSEQAIAELMGTSVGTVKSQLSRGLANLRTVIEPEGALR